MVCRIGVLPGDHLRPVPKRWKEPGTAGVSRQVRAFTESQRVKWSLLILIPPCALLQPLYGL